MTFSVADVRYIVDGHAGAWLDGPVSWIAVNQAWRGEVAVWAAGFDPGEVKFILMTTGRPNAPTFVLMIRGEDCRRLDVNQEHVSLPSTHEQGRDCSEGQGWERDARNLYPAIPENGIVDGEQYAATFLAYAASLGIGQGTFEWVDAPEGRPR